MGYRPPPTNTMAVSSMVASLVGVPLMCLCFLGGIPAAVGIVLGGIALSQISRTGQPGKGMALTGLIVGIVLVVLSVLYLLLFLAGIASSPGDYSYNA